MSRVTTCLLLLALLNGCAGTPALDSGEWTEHRDAVGALQNWGFSGRIAVSTQAGGDTASLRWQQRRDNFAMTLSGPMGLKEATLLREEGELILLRNGERRRLAPEDDLLRAEFGWRLPLDYLPWWLRGLPAPGPARQQLADGRLAWLEQDGWRIEYAEYRDIDNTRLPRVIRFQRADVSGKILLKRWTLTP